MVKIISLLLMLIWSVEANKEKNDTLISDEAEKITLNVKAFATTVDENPKMGKSLGKVFARCSDDKATLKYALRDQSRAGAISVF